MGRPKTVAILREKALSHGEKALERLAKFADMECKDDPRMAAVVERACEALLDRIGLTPMKPAEAPPEKPEMATSPDGMPAEALMAGLGPPGALA